MSNEAANALAALGIATPAADVVPVSAAETAIAPNEAKATKTDVEPSGADAPKTETTTTETTGDNAPSFEAGSITDLSFDEIPAQKRPFSGGGKTIYGIEDLPAPGTGGKKYHGKLVEYKGGDVTAFKRSVQSSATGQNAKAKDAGVPNYYITRSHEVEGKFAGVVVIRTDERPTEGSEAAEGSND